MFSRVELQSIQIKRFGCFADQSFVFKAGINVLAGPAESGKSTIVSALKAVLFRDASGESDPEDYFRKGEPAPRLVLMFGVDDKQFRLVRDYHQKVDELTDSDDISYRGEEIGNKLFRYFGTGSRNVFDLINTVSGDDINEPDEKKHIFRAALEAPVFAGFDRSRADKFIASEIGKLEISSVAGKSELDMVSEQLSARLQEKSSLDERLTDLRKDRKELDQIQDQAMQFQKDSMHLEEQIVGAEAYQQLNVRMAAVEEKLHSQMDNYSRADQIMEDLERIDKERSALLIPEPMKLADYMSRNAELVERVDCTKEQMDALGQQKKGAGRGVAGATLVLLTVCLVYLAHMGNYFNAGPASEYILYSIPVMAIIWIVRLGAYFIRILKKGKSTRDFRNGVSELDEFYAEINQAYNLKAADPIAELDERVQRTQFLGMAADNLKATIGHLSDDQGMEYLVKQKEQIETEVAQLNSELAPLIQFAASAANLPQIKEDATSKKVRAKALLEHAKQLAIKVVNIEKLEDNVATVEREMESLKSKHKEVSNKIEILKISRMAMNRAADNLIEDTFVAFSRSTGAFLSRMTGGRYTEVLFSKDPVKFEVKSSQSGAGSKISHLSASTRDAIYISLRLAALSHLSFEFAAPFICDQADVRLDAKRRDSLYTILLEQAKARQIIVTSNSDDFPIDGVHHLACKIATEQLEPA